MRNFKLLLDNGHSGLLNGVYTTPGKRKEWEDFTFYEGVWNREVVAKLIKLCESNAIEVVNIVPEQEDIELPERTRRANEIGGDLFLSIHSNGFDDENANGYETWIYRKASKASIEYAKIIHENYLQVNDLKDRGIKKSGFYVIKHTKMPAVLVECGFYTNRKECMYLIEEQDKVVEGIFNGILEIRANYLDKCN